MEGIMGRRERKKLQSKKTIMASAVKKFLEKGVSETSIADIMNESRLGIGTFYNYFKSKDALLLCLLGQIADDTCLRAEAMIKEKRRAADVLRDIVATLSGSLDENRFVLPLFLSAADRSASPYKRAEPRLVPKLRSVFVDLIKYGQERREFRGDISPEIVAEMFHSIFQAASFSSLPYSFIENVKIKTDLLLGGLTPRN